MHRCTLYRGFNNLRFACTGTFQQDLVNEQFPSSSLYSSWYTKNTVQAPATLVDAVFSTSMEKKPITWKLMSISRKTQNKSCTSSGDLINGVFRKYMTTYEFSNMMMEYTSQDTITDSSLWASLHKIGWFLLQTSKICKESLFFLLCFESNMNTMWWTGPEIFMS